MKTVKIILSTLILFFGYFYIYVQQERTYGLKQLEKKYTADNLLKKCEWTEKKTLLNCYKQDYLSFLRNSCPYMAQSAFKLQQKIFKRDYRHHNEDKGKLLSAITNLELSNLFFQISNEDKLNRKRNQIPGLMLANFFRYEVINLFYDQEKEIIRTKKEFSKELQSSKHLSQRFYNAIKKYHEIKFDLAK